MIKFFAFSLREKFKYRSEVECRPFGSIKNNYPIMNYYIWDVVRIEILSSKWTIYSNDVFFSSFPSKFIFR